MINHVRTLLLNLDGSLTPGNDFPGEEFVPSGYRAKTLSGSLQSVHNALFGGSADRGNRNLRLRQYLAILHDSELDVYVTALDPRITYLPFTRDLFARLLPVATVDQLKGDDATFELLNVSSTMENQGRIRFQWRIDILSATTLRIRQFDASQQMTTETVETYSDVSGISSTLILPGTSLQFRFQTGVLNAAWLINALGIPTRRIPAIVESLERLLSDSVKTDLFGSLTNTEEPYRTCRNLWEGQSELPYRLGAVVLALAYQINLL